MIILPKTISILSNENSAALQIPATRASFDPSEADLRAYRAAIFAGNLPFLEYKTAQYSIH